MKKLARRWIAIFVVCVMALQLSACNNEEYNADKSTIVQAPVMEIEKYGHAVRDVTTADLIAAGYEFGDVVCVRLGDY